MVIRRHLGSLLLSILLAGCGQSGPGGDGGSGGSPGTGGATTATGSGSGSGSGAGAAAGSASGGATSAGGSTSTGPTPECATPADCLDPGTCQVATCESGSCGSAAAPDGLAEDQVAGDCQSVFCHAGDVMPFADDADVPPATDCMATSCVGGVPMMKPEPYTKECDDNGGAYCSGTGLCAQCFNSGDCGIPPNVYCDPITFTCEPSPCTNGVKDLAETDIDCGGVLCDPCLDGEVCAGSSDCWSNHCEGGLCLPPSCNDGIQNHLALGETDTDCGGTCPKCLPGKSCYVNEDCVGAECANSVCAENCIDGLQDQDETGPDCGGLCSATYGEEFRCENGLGCEIAADCQSLFCNAGICSECSTNAQCPGDKYCDGGLCIPKLLTGQACSATAECQSGHCVDGFCCGQSACGTCESCGVPFSEGACTPVASGTPDAACPTGTVCNGTGICQKTNGKPCFAGIECLSHYCVDGVCCGGGCTNTCRSCALPGSVGTCTLIPAGQDPSNECAGSLTCNGAGSCN